MPLLPCRLGPGITVPEIQAAGYKLAIYPVFTLFAAVKAMREAVNELKTKGTPAGYFKEKPRALVDTRVPGIYRVCPYSGNGKEIRNSVGWSEERKWGRR